VLVQHDDAARLYARTSGALVRELHTGPLGHFAKSLARHPDGQHVAVTTQERVAFFSLASGELRAHLEVSSAVGAVVTPDGDVLFTARRGSADVVLFRWSPGASTPTAVAELGKHHNVMGMVLSPDARSVWISLSTFLCRVELGDASTTASPRDERCLGAPVLLPDSGKVAVGTLDGRVQVWRQPEPSEESEAVAGPSALHEVHLAVLQGGALIAASAADQRVSLLVPGERTPRARLEGPRSHLSALVADGPSALWVGAEDGTLWHLPVGALPEPSKKRGTVRFELTVHPTPHVTALAVVAPGRAVSADMQGAVGAWERGQEDARAFRAGPKDDSGGSRFSIASICVTGGAVVVRQGAAGFQVLDAAQLSVAAKLPHKGASTAVTCGDVVLTTGGKLLQSWRSGSWERLRERDSLGAATVGRQWVEPLRALLCLDERNTLSLVSVEDLKTRASRGFADVTSVVDVRADPSGVRVAIAYGDSQRQARVRLWEPASGKVVTLAELARAPWFVGEELVVVTPGGELRWYAPDGTPLRQLDLTPLVGSSWATLVAAREDALLVLSERRLAVLEPRSGTPRVTHVLDQGILHAAFDGDTVAYTTDGGRVSWLSLGP